MRLREAVEASFGIFKTAIAGRARRSQYWYLLLAYFLIIGGELAALALIDSLGFPIGLAKIISGILTLIIMATQTIGAAFFMTVYPFVAIRRMHDLNKSGWWFLIGFIPLIGWIIMLVWLCSRGTIGDNRFGPDPLAQVATSA